MANKVFQEPITFTSKLVLEGKHVLAVEEWIGQNLVHQHGRIKDKYILYASSRDGFSNSTFHELCDGVGPTLTIIQLINGRLFGGFASLPWESEGGPKADRAAFLFSLTDGVGRAPEKMQQFQNLRFAVSHYPDRGPLFGVGAGADLGLNLDKESLAHCRSHVGATYRLPRYSAKDPLVSETFLAGKLDGWDLDEVVVYYCSPNAAKKVEQKKRRGTLAGADAALKSISAATDSHGSGLESQLQSGTSLAGQRTDEPVNAMDLGTEQNNKE